MSLIFFVGIGNTYVSVSKNSLKFQVLSRITSEIDYVTNLYEQMKEIHIGIHPHLLLLCTYSVQTYHYEVWMQKIMFQFDAFLLCVKNIIYKLLKLYTKESLITAVRYALSIKFYSPIYN